MGYINTTAAITCDAALRF